jgi:hypothetical protein
MGVIVKINKIFTKNGQSSSGDDFTRYSFYGKAEDGSEFKASSFAPIGENVKEGETYSFLIEKKGKFINITDVVPVDNKAQEENKQPENKPQEKKEQKLPNEEKEEQKGEEKPDWDKIRREKKIGIYTSVAMQVTTEEMQNVMNIPGQLEKIGSIADYLKAKKEVFDGNFKLLIETDK